MTLVIPAVKLPIVYSNTAASPGVPIGLAASCTVKDGKVATKYILLIKSPFLEMEQVTRFPKSTAPANVCSIDSIAKFVLRLYTSFQKVICGLPVR